jgi:HK97 gp10 family phage protein
MSMTTFKLDTRELDKIVRNMDGNKNKVGRLLGFELEAEAKKRAPRLTSAMANSIYTVTKEHDGYANASGAATQANPKAETQPHPKPTGNVLARVGPCVNYAEFVEFGTSRMAAQPYLTPAAEVVFTKLNSGEYWRKLVE